MRKNEHKPVLLKLGNQRGVIASIVPLEKREDVRRYLLSAGASRWTRILAHFLRAGKNQRTLDA
jgi:hypothetical protein